MEKLNYEDELQKFEKANENDELTDEELETLMLITQEAKTPEELEEFYNELEQGNENE